MNQAPFVQVRVTRNPMMTQVKTCLAHEYFLLQHVFPEAEIIEAVMDGNGKPKTRTVDPQDEYDRLEAAYSSRPGAEQSLVQEVFGPAWGSSWRDAVTGGMNVIQMLEEKREKEQAAQAGPAPAASIQTKTSILQAITAQMQAEDPGHEMEKWWMTDGRPESGELTRRYKELGFDGKVSAKERDAMTEAQPVNLSNDPGETPAAPQPPETAQVDADAVMARLDELNVEYEPDSDSPEVLVQKLETATVEAIQALGGEIQADATLEQLSEQLVKLEAEQQ